MVCTQEEYDAGTAKVKGATKNGIPILTEKWLQDSIKAGKLVAVEKYKIAAGKASSEEEEEEEEKKPAKKATKKAPPKTKRARASQTNVADSESEEKEEKKQDPPAKTSKPAPVQAAKDVKEEEKPQMTKIIAKGAAAVDTVAAKLISAPVHVLQEGSDVYDCMLNQTEIAHNNNKFYVIQVLESDSGGKLWCWNRWGRVGATGQNSLTPAANKQAAISMFQAKFKEKTKNNWTDRKNFKKYPGKYELVEIDYGAGEEEEEVKPKARTTGPIPESKLHKRVQDLIK